MLITIIIAVYNAAPSLQRALDSALAQQGVAVQLVVIDGGSTDGSVDILKKYSSQLAYWESSSDRGIYHAWNKGIAHAQGDWVHFLGADDTYWDEYSLARLAATLERANRHDISLVYGQVAMLDSRGLPFAILGKPWSEIAPHALDKMPFPHPGVLHRRALFERYGSFDESFRIAGDYEWFCRVLQHEQAQDVPQAIVVGMTLGGVSTDPRRLAMVVTENCHARQKNGLKSLTLSPYVRILQALAIFLPLLLPVWVVKLLIKSYYRQESIATQFLSGDSNF